MRGILLAALLGIASAASSCAAAQEPAAKESSSLALETRVFELPEGSRPHDAAPGPAGQIWYTAQRHGALGIIDVASGEVRQVPLGKGSAPHGVIQAADGTAWITDGGQNAIVRYDPKTEKIDVWKLPEGSGYTNLNTGVFAGDGTYWFTGQNGIYGKVDPQTHQVSVWKDPEGRGPYGIAATPAGEIFYSSLAGSHLGRIDRASGEVTMIEPPDQGAGLRRVWADSHGDLWVSGWNSGKLYRYHPGTGAWDQWPLPVPGAQAYAIYVDGHDRVWLSDFNSNNTYVFDPAAESFQAVAGSGANAGVRQILGRGNEVYLPESGLDRLMLVTVGE